MADNKTFSLLAVLHEINDREFRKKLADFPQELHYYATLASSVIGAENSKRIRETPEGVAENSEEFVSSLLEITDSGNNEIFREVLENFLIQTLKDELRFCCFNCIKFNECLDVGNLSVGELFQRRVRGEETQQLREEISHQVETALQKTPYMNTDEAHRLCMDFRHHYSVSNVGEVFGRYADIAVSLQGRFGIDYKRIQQRMVEINMSFFKKHNEHQA